MPLRLVRRLACHRSGYLSGCRRRVATHNLVPGTPRPSALKNWPATNETFAPKPSRLAMNAAAPATLSEASKASSALGIWTLVRRAWSVAGSLAITAFFPGALNAPEELELTPEFRVALFVQEVHPAQEALSYQQRRVGAEFDRRLFRSQWQGRVCPAGQRQRRAIRKPVPDRRRQTGFVHQSRQSGDRLGIGFQSCREGHHGTWRDFNLGVEEQDQLRMGCAAPDVASTGFPEITGQT